MNLRHLELFYALMHSGSLTEAASTLGISQPAASKLLKHTELKLGFNLFQRAKGKLEPTYEAQILYEEIKPIYQKINDLNQFTHTLAQNPHGKIRLGCSANIGLGLISKITARFSQKYPDVDFSIMIESDALLEQKILDRKIDLALSFVASSETEIVSESIFEIPLCYIDSQAQQAPIELHQIQYSRWIQPDIATLNEHLMISENTDHSRLSAQNNALVAQLVKQNLGCSIIDRDNAEQVLSKEMIYPLKEPLSIKVYLLQNANLKLSLPIKNLIQILQKQQYL